MTAKTNKMSLREIFEEELDKTKFTIVNHPVFEEVFVPPLTRKQRRAIERQKQK